MRLADLHLDLERIGCPAKLIDVGAGDEPGWFCRANDQPCGRPLSIEVSTVPIPRSHLPTTCWR